MRRSFVSLVALSLLAAATIARADTFLSSTSGVDYAADTSAGFYTGPIGYSSATANAFVSPGAFVLDTKGTAYSDAGLVLYFNGGLTLGQLAGVSVTQFGTPVSINLWLDSGGDGKFFAFDSSNMMTGLNGDSYGGASTSVVDRSTLFYMFGGDGAGNQYTLAQLIAGDDAGINANTQAAIWLGITNPPAGTYEDDAYITEVDVARAPEPASLMLLGTGFLSLVGFAQRRRA